MKCAADGLLLDGAAQVAQQLQAIRLIGILLGIVHRQLIAVAFGDIHGDVGAFQQAGRVRAVLRVNRNTDTRADREAVMVHFYRFLQRTLQLAGDNDCVVLRGLR